MQIDIVNDQIHRLPPTGKGSTIVAVIGPGGIPERPGQFCTACITLHRALIAEIRKSKVFGTEYSICEDSGVWWHWVTVTITQARLDEIVGRTFDTLSEEQYLKMCEEHKVAKHRERNARRRLRYAKKKAAALAAPSGVQ